MFEGNFIQFQDKPLKKVLHDVEVANMEKLDRWRLHLSVKTEAEKHPKATDNLPEQIAVFNNYFSMGIDAHIALQFHNARNANSDKFTSRTRNLLFYGLEGGKDLVVHKWKHLMDSVRSVSVSDSHLRAHSNLLILRENSSRVAPCLEFDCYSRGDCRGLFSDDLY